MAKVSSKLEVKIVDVSVTAGKVRVWTEIHLKENGANVGKMSIMTDKPRGPLTSIEEDVKECALTMVAVLDDAGKQIWEQALAIVGKK